MIYTVETGIREMRSGKYEATKSISGKRYTKRFKTLKEARKWRKQFNIINDDSVDVLFKSIEDSLKLLKQKYN